MQDLKWIYFVSRRISRVDKKSRSAAASWLASAGICLGVMALIVIMSVMNGFQMSYIDSIIEISSHHVQVSRIQKCGETEFEQRCRKDKEVSGIVPFYEAQGLMAGNTGMQAASLVRAVPAGIMQEDPGFANELKIIAGEFDLSEPDSIVVGVRLARQLHLRVGSTVNILALSGSSSQPIFSRGRTFTVKGIFRCGYADINASYSFIGIASAKNVFGEQAEKKYGIKLKSGLRDAAFIRKVHAWFPEAEAVSWREYNRSFFGVLRMEKNVLFMLVLLIFVVVAVNIFNSMRRLVFERKEEIAVLSALGASPEHIQNVFVMQGACAGTAGSVPGLLLGIFISLNMRTVFFLFSKIQFGIQFAAAFLFHHGAEKLLSENSMFAVYARIPVRIFLHEVILIFLFGIFSALIASWLASRSILKLTVSEVLRNE